MSLINKIKALFSEFCKAFKEILSCLGEIYEDSEKSMSVKIFETVFLVIIIVPVFFVFFLFLLFATVALCIQTLFHFCSTNDASALTQTAFTEYVVRDILCMMLRNNAKELGIVAPQTVADIVPVQYPVIQAINGLPFARFIVLGADDEEPDFGMMQTLLNTKTAQFLQENYRNFPITYCDQSLLRIFSIGYDQYHADFFHIDIMVIDTDAKYKFVTAYDARKSSTSHHDYNREGDRDF